MVEFNTAQTIYLTCYCVLFALLCGWFCSYQRNFPKKAGTDTWIYFIVFFVLICVLIGGAFCVLLASKTFKGAAICLVTLKWDNQKEVYESNPLYTQQITDEEALKLSWYFSHHSEIKTFYQYNLIDDQNNMQSYECAVPDLLDYVNTVYKELPGEKQTA